MKITGSRTIQEVYRPGPSGKKTLDETDKNAPAAQVEVSKDAAWIESLKVELGETSEVRSDLVNEVKKQLADGTFESSVDMNNVLDGLLSDF